MGKSHEKVTLKEFVEAWNEVRSAVRAARILGITERAVQSRRSQIEKDHPGMLLPVGPRGDDSIVAAYVDSRAIYKLNVYDGVVIIGSDIHVWPGPRTTMQRAFLQFVKELKPFATIVNGDVFDGATISRYPSIGWESKPTVARELEAVQDFMGDLSIANGKGFRIWSAGNHDLRFESKVAQHLPEFKGVRGVHLKDHIPDWTPCWRVDVNEDVLVKHRMRGGEHADWNNVIKSGKTTVTGHDHRLGVTPYVDFRGLRWGVRTGYQGDHQTDPQFVHYLEADEPNWWPGFAVLTFRKGALLWPELVTKHADGVVNFRGELFNV